MTVSSTGSAVDEHKNKTKHTKKFKFVVEVRKLHATHQLANRQPDEQTGRLRCLYDLLRLLSEITTYLVLCANNCKLTNT